MFDGAENSTQLDQKDTARFILELFHRIIMHHGMWFNEVRHQMGSDKAHEILQQATEKSFEIQMKHLAAELGFDLIDGIPEPLLTMDHAGLQRLKQRVAKNWLVGDGVWFQAIESAEGMNEAKRCNDSCWAHFAPYEAFRIKQLLGLPEHPGLAGLKRALGFRVYESINTQSITEQTEDSFVFQMNECRVQQARKRRGLPDYPCKSAGLVEYNYFAQAIDARIETTCLGCPPDEHPEQWFCAWKFSLAR